jgi:tryptophan synthase alpha chain
VRLYRALVGLSSAHVGFVGLGGRQTNAFLGARVYVLDLARVLGRELVIQLVTPLTPRDRALRICETSTGFVYYVSVAGITGERTQLPPELAENVAWLREQTKLPICIGFGVSQPEHVKLLAPVADGLIVGSAIVRRMADAASRPREAVIKEIGDYVESLIAALPQG